MKYISILALSFAILLPTFGVAQNPTVKKLYEQYSGKPGFTTVNVSKKMFSLFAKVTSEEEHAAFKELVANLDGIQVLTADSTVSDAFGKMLMMEMKPRGYEELLAVREEGKKVEILIKENGDIIEELLVLAIEGNKASVISITGRINMSQLSELSRNLKIDGLEELEKVK